MTNAPVQLITTAVINLLKDNLAVGSRVYDSKVPPDATHHYWLVTHIAGGGYGGPPLTQPEADTTLVYQVDSVGARRDQAQWAADKAATIMVGRGAGGALTFALAMPAGWNECARMRNDVPGGVEVEGAPPNLVFTASNRFEVVVTPT